MNKDEIAGLVEKLTPALKLLEELEVGQDCPEYAYAKGKGFQSMTYIPEAFEALRELPVMLDALTTLSAENERLERRNASDRECWRLAAENCAALSARVETLEAALRRCFKGETQAIIPFTNPLLSSEVRR